MSNETFSQSLIRQERLSLVIGFAVAMSHLVVTCMYALGQSYFMPLALTTPSLLLSPILAVMPASNSSVVDTLVKFLFIGFSSFYYGVTASLLVSGHRNRRWKGIILLCLLLFSIILVIQMLP